MGQTVPHVGVGVAFLCLYHRRVERFAQSKQLVFLSTHTQKKKPFYDSDCLTPLGCIYSCSTISLMKLSFTLSDI